MSEVPQPEEYLKADFDAKTLKVAQLRGILLQYDISLPATAKKADLVKAFEEEVQPRGTEILKATSRVQASSKGIVSMSDAGTETGSVTSEQKPKRGRGRPSKKVKSEAISENEEPPVKKPRGRPKKTPQPEVEVEIKKTRRGTRSVSRKIAETPVPQIKGESGSSESPSVPPSVPSAPPSSRKRGSASVASEMPALLEPPSEKKKPRKSAPASKRKSEAAMLMEDVKEEEEDKEGLRQTPKRPKTPRRSEESGFSDYNPFQSGSEDAPDREKRRRKSSVGLSVKKTPQPRYSEPAPRSKTETPGTLRRVGPSRESLRTPPKSPNVKAAKTPQDSHTASINAAEEYNRVIADKLAKMSPKGKEKAPEVRVESHVSPQESIAHKLDRVATTPTTSPGRTIIPLSMLGLLFLAFISNWKTQSASIGVCDPGETTNDILLNRQSAIDDANACISRRTSAALDGATSEVVKSIEMECDVSALPLIPFLPRPKHCTPCPQHGICEDGKLLACEPEYLLSPHPLQFAAPVLDGLPGLGPRALAPSCKPDTAKKRMIGSLAQEIEKDLARGRGYVVCANLGGEDGKKGQGERFGMEENTLRSRYLARKAPKISMEQFEEIFDAALADLVSHDDVIESIDHNGHSWFAASRTELTIGCKIKLEMISLLERWKSQLFSSAAIIAAIMYIRSTLKHRQAEKYRAEELVQVVIKRLQDQEYLHYSDPVTTPHPFIPPDQLRDLVMPPKESTTSRTRLWRRVQEQIEANSNVSVKEREVRGEIWKTWEWNGVAERHVSFE